MAKVTAVIDMGSNSCRMVIYKKTSRYSFSLLKEVKSRVRIGEKAYENGGKLQEFAINRAFTALSDFVTIAKSYGARKILCVATSALRDAPNAKDFIKRVQRSLHINIKVIDGQKEAYLGGVAAANLLSLPKQAITIDIGGGSTEFAVIEEGKVVQTHSIDIGTVRVKELFFDKENFDEGLEFIDKEFEKLNLTSSVVIAIGGTARAISKSIMKTTNYPLDKLHGYEYELQEFHGYIESLMHHNEKRLKKLKIKSDRIDTIKPGVAIFLSALKALKTQKVISSGVGVREGVYLSDLLRRNNHRFPPNFNPSVKNLIAKYAQNLEYIQINKRAMKLLEMLHPIYSFSDEEKMVLSTSAKLASIGEYVNIYKFNKMGEIIILNELNYGFTHKQIATIATLVRYSKNRFPPSYSDFSSLAIPYERMCIMSFILALAIKLDNNSQVQLRDKTLVVECDYVVQSDLESLQLPSLLKLKVNE